MVVIVEKLGKNTKNNHKILNSNPQTPVTFSSYLLLKEYYFNLDISLAQENDWRYYYIIRRHFLRKQKKLHNGHWVCHYCKNPIYKIQKRNSKRQQKDCVTIDHINPISKGYSKLNTKNMVECCYSCNQNKKDINYIDFINK